MSVLNFFKKTGQNILKRMTRFKELGTYRSVFTGFGNDIYKSEVVRYCIRPLAEHSSKANARVIKDDQLERLLNFSPNKFMTGKDFLAKVRNRLEIYNTAFIYIQRNEKNKVTGLYPVPCKSFEALEYADRLFIKFEFKGQAVRELVLPWEDLAVLRKDYNESDIAGDSNDSILNTLELISTSDQGVANAIKATANLRGILKSTKAILDPEDVKKQKEDFVRDYLNLENEGGIASLDATQEFTPISMNPVTASWEQKREFREEVERYYGVSDAIIMSNYTEAELEAFYDSRIEPFLVALSLELTRKIYSEKEIAFGNEIVYESNRLQFSSTKTKLSLVSLVDRGALTPNEWRMILNLAPIEGGDEPIRRLDTAVIEAPATDPADDKE